VAQGGPEPVDPSGGQFVWQPGPPLTGGGGEGFVQFAFNMPEAGTYSIWGRVVTWDGNSDSYWITVVPPDPADENPQETQDTTYRWSPAQGNEWHWDKIDQWLNGGTFDLEWEIPAGPVTLTLWSREDATMIDCIYITDNLDTDEANVAPKLPSEVDPLPSAVDSQDKLSTVWARMKSE
jgi:hypothetical protein